MPKIHILDSATANLIAAGEVVERPASVVKELIENSIDAKATKIIIEIKGDGTDLIKITDNGTGMSKEDAEIAFLKHATSKIIKQDDLFAIKTLGFRGEALAAISSVSKITLFTKEEGSSIGQKITIDAGVISSSQEVVCIKGTTIEVKNLFFNTPARLKFMKTEKKFGIIKTKLLKK
jgi:DNA mismatch repair protein MutL